MEACYVRAKYRQARDEQGRLALSIEEEEKILEGLPLVNVATDS